VLPLAGLVTLLLGSTGRTVRRTPS
jgi:hypothetical protein